MFFHRTMVSLFVLASLVGLGFLADGVVFTKDRHELAYNGRNLVRLHIIANSNRRDDQLLKLRVRDALLAETGPLFSRCRRAEEALALVKAKEGYLRATVKKVISASGRDYDVRIETGWFNFPTKIYPFGTLPAGKYRAVRIIIGEGRGDNWWCVLFPPLCFTTDKTRLPEGQPVRFRLLFWERLLAGRGQKADEFWRPWARFFDLLPPLNAEQSKA